MKTLFTYLLLLFVSTNVFGQSCLPNATFFYTQADIDDFLVNNPTCTTIEGDLTIMGNDITNLNGLQNITTFNNGLWIDSSPLLTSFSGLENVTYVGDYFELGSLPLIENLDEFSNLTYVGGALDIINLASLSSISGLENITSSPNYLIIWANPMLTNLTGLHNIQSVSTTLKIQDNALLNDIESLNNFDLSTLNNLIIKENPQLSTCNQSSICNAINNGTTNSDIENNHNNGCNTIAEIDSTCTLNSTKEIELNNFNFYPNPAKGEITFNSEGIKKVEIFSLTGQLLLKQRNANTTLNVSNLKPGVYFMTIEYLNIVKTKKIIIEP